MSFLKIMTSNWKKKSTAEKIGTVLDILTTIGGGLIGGINGKIYSQNMKPMAKICVRLTMAGMSMAIGECAGQQLRKNYAEPLGKMIDTIGAKLKEENADEQQCA